MGENVLPAGPDKVKDQELKRRVSDTFSKNLKHYRKVHNMTQEALAEAASLHITYVGHLELGKYHPTLYTAWKLSKALNITLDMLIG